MTHRPKLAVVLVGEIHDDGFNASGLAGAEAAAREGLAELTFVTGLPYDDAAILRAMRNAVPSQDGLVFIGGQGDRTVAQLAAEFPDKRFAVVQGHIQGRNLASYDVRQEESAFLAGCLAAWMTESGIVAHLSGHRVKPGLKGRAAFVQGVRHADPGVRVLTAFCGTQDDNAITREWAAAQITAGADILFTMLNGARAGAIDACRAGGAWQIGNALDWTIRAPDVFLASAMARIDLGVHRAIADLARGSFPDSIVKLGLAEGDYVSLRLGDHAAPGMAGRIAAIAAQIREGTITIAEDYSGPEFTPGDQSCSPAA